jgi:pSer/pThr/pTyr-binding forkhead associated (FHA) protein
VTAPLRAPDWLHEARADLAGPGRYLAMRDDDEPIRPFRIEDGWTRIGRSARADIRLDDPSVSRRHALLVSEPGRVLRVLDDRSLNGVMLNGETIEWARLADGDELGIGFHRLFVLEV